MIELCLLLNKFFTNNTLRCLAYKTLFCKILGLMTFKEVVNLYSVLMLDWITISTVGCDSAVVNVYDSINRKALTTSLKKMVADLIHTSQKFIRINYVPMQYQVGGGDCGLFTIASACAICHGQNPGTLKFEQHGMRSHLIEALEKKLMSPFPGITRRTKCSPHCDRINVYCVCRLPDDGRKMVQCSKCREWYHTKCPKFFYNLVLWKMLANLTVAITKLCTVTYIPFLDNLIFAVYNNS